MARDRLTCGFRENCIYPMCAGKECAVALEAHIDETRSDRVQRAADDVFVAAMQTLDDPLARALGNSPLYPCPDLNVEMSVEDEERVGMATKDEKRAAAAVDDVLATDLAVLDAAEMANIALRERSLDRAIQMSPPAIGRRHPDEWQVIIAMAKDFLRFALGEA